MKITTKRLEIIFVIVYFMIAILCFIFASKKCLVASFFGALVGIGDWYVIKLMSVRWLKKGRYSFFENSLRYVLVGISIWFLFQMKLDVLGIVAGLSVVPLAIVFMSFLSFIDKKNITV